MAHRTVSKGGFRAGVLGFAMVIGVAGCASEPTDLEQLEAQGPSATLATSTPLAPSQVERSSPANAQLKGERLADAEAAAGPTEEEAINGTYCCQIWIFEEPQALFCDTMSTAKAWARTKCYALAASVPFSYPVLASGSCDNYRPTTCPAG